MNKAMYLLLQEAKVEFINVLWCDYANIIRGKAIHRNLFWKTGPFPISISKAQLGVSGIGDYVVADSGYLPVGEIFLKPDWDTLRILSWNEGFACVLGEMEFFGEESVCDPRKILKKSIQKLEESGLEIKAAFENEFTLFDMKTGEPADKSLFAMPDAALRSGEFIIDLSQTLEKLGMKVERFYPESGFGQYEITTQYTDALDAADNQILFRQAVHGVAFKHGYLASFLPKISETQAGNGCHIHFSLWKKSRNLFENCYLGKEDGEGEFFLQGLLSHLPALAVLTIPSPNSYRRLKPHCWSGAYRCWGIDNREAAIRGITNPSGVIDHFELKMSDAAANPYLALAGLIFTGLDGLFKKESLIPPTNFDPGDLSEEELSEKGILRLPKTLGISIDEYRKDTFLSNCFGDAFNRAYLSIRKEELIKIQGLNFEEEVALLKERY